MPAARAALAHFEGHLSASSFYDASLCLSELVTNAVQHPSRDLGDELGLELMLTEDALRVHVIDPGSGFQPGKPTEGDERGWGLFIVDQLSTCWGTEPEDQRTIMWFEIAREDAPRAERADEDRPAASDAEGPRPDDIASAVARPAIRPAVP